MLPTSGLVRRVAVRAGDGAALRAAVSGGCQDSAIERGNVPVRGRCGQREQREHRGAQEARSPRARRAGVCVISRGARLLLDVAMGTRMESGRRGSSMSRVPGLAVSVTVSNTPSSLDTPCPGVCVLDPPCKPGHCHYGRAEPQCPSCHGSGWAVVRVGGIAYGSGPCRCVGGSTWAGGTPSQEWLDAQNEPGHSLYGKSWAEVLQT